MGLVHNERVKLLAAALNNTGIASIVTGVIAPAANFLYGSLATQASPGRVAIVGTIWFASGAVLIVAARLALGGLQE